MSPWHQSFQRIQIRLPEIGGFSLIGLGVILLLSSLFYLPFILQQENHAIEQAQHISQMNTVLSPGHHIGITMLIVACSAITYGYFIINKHVAFQSKQLIWLTILEVLAESSILGWLLVTSGIVLPIPSSAWSILSAIWLEDFLGVFGSLVLPIVVLSVCFYLKRNLRKFGSWSRSVQIRK